MAELGHKIENSPLRLSPEERAEIKQLGLVKKISAEKYRFLAGEEVFPFVTNKLSEDCPYPRGVKVYGDEGWLEEGHLEERVDFAIEIKKEKFDEVLKKKLYMPQTEEYIFYQDEHVMKTVYNDQNPAIEFHEANKDELEKLLKTMELVNNKEWDFNISGITKLDS